MFLSVFHVFKIGIGPSSSHTMGPMTAARRFVATDIAEQRAKLSRITVSLHGSLAFTGKGHGTDRAIALGLLGHAPDEIDPNEIDPALERLARERSLSGPAANILFDPATDIVFDTGPPLPSHVNGMIFRAYDAAGDVLVTRTYYSVGGGFVQAEDELGGEGAAPADPYPPVPFPFDSAAAMLRLGDTSGLSIADMQRANEHAVADIVLDDRLDDLWHAMRACIERGLASDGTLPGGLNVRRRAPGLYRQLAQQMLRNEAGSPTLALDWLNAFAMAVNEENAAGGRVVTAPTNGAAGVVPAVIRYYRDHLAGTDSGIRNFLLVAAAIGGLIKRGASISGAEVGCQGEIGSAAAMAAAGLAAALDGSNAQVENAAEIALEHHLGMTCDPIRGLVQVPCIERNGFGAVKAVNSAMLALRGDGSHIVSLDNCIRTMRDTGRDMNTRYKETSLGGLAVNVVEC